MLSIADIDVTFDFRQECPGSDPDRFSPTLRAYHQALWSKPLPTGGALELEDVWRRGYLRHESEIGIFHLSSDTVLRTFHKHPRMRHIVEQIPEADREDFSTRGYTIGGMIVFPGNRVDRCLTINQARGMHPRIADRFDLTLECIRRHYAGEQSPLTKALSRYPDFFALFGSFSGYVEFFHLQDLVDDDGSVRFFLPFESFDATRALPQSVPEYLDFRAEMLRWIDARNARIDALK